MSRSLLLLQRWHDLTDRAHTLLARLSLRVGVLRRATQLSRLHELTINVLLVLDVRVVLRSVRTLRRVAKIDRRIGLQVDRLDGAMLLHRLRLLISRRRLRRNNSSRHVSERLLGLHVEEALSVVSEVLERVADQSDLAIRQAVARSVDEALDASELIAHSVARDTNHLALVVLEAGSLTLLLEVRWHRDKAVLFGKSGAGSSRRGSLILTLTRVVDGSEVRHEKALIEGVVASLVHSQIEDGAANLEQVSREITLEILHDSLVVLLLQV